MCVFMLTSVYLPTHLCLMASEAAKRTQYTLWQKVAKYSCRSSVLHQEEDGLHVLITYNISTMCKCIFTVLRRF